MNKQQLPTKIWKSAKKCVLKLRQMSIRIIFYKYLSDKELIFLKENDFTVSDIKSITEDDAETVKYQSPQRQVRQIGKHKKSYA